MDGNDDVGPMKRAVAVHLDDAGGARRTPERRFSSRRLNIAGAMDLCA